MKLSNTMLSTACASYIINVRSPQNAYISFEAQHKIEVERFNTATSTTLFSQFSTSISYMNRTLEMPQNLSNSETFPFNIGEGYSKHSESQFNNLLNM
jgi:hypothetical protein